MAKKKATTQVEDVKPQSTGNPLIDLILAGDVDKVKTKFVERTKVVDKALEQYNIEGHEINKRPKKYNDKQQEIPQAKIPIPFQKKIVFAAKFFLFGKPVKLIQKSKDTDDAFALIESLWEDMRNDSKNREVAELLFSETECAKLFVEYRDPNITDPEELKKPGTVRVKCLILARSKGDTLYTRFNEFGVLEAIARGYTIIVEGKSIEHFDIYTSGYNYLCTKNNNKDWDVVPVENRIKKIQLVYYCQKLSEWHDVQPAIETRETLTSRRSDNNIATGDPILLLEGTPISLPERADTAKVVILSEGGKASYLAPQMAIDMVKDEREDLDHIIYYMTDTPDFDKLKNIDQRSGEALKMMFFNTILKSLSKQEVFAEMLDREINILKAFITNIIDVSPKMAEQVKKLKVAFEFGNPLPDNVEGLIDMLSTATGGKATMSQKTAVSLNPLVKDAVEETAELTKEALSATIED
ncbi:phage portal protein [Desertivirga xinjiangensis]|uniref:phage portal protein n=1 Tax=Desertivirga xinjiangensis TaxID=539206 RepID=UPI00210F0ACA|nr:phage portal protein [Pedobacter xinjiangensis]